MPAYKIHVTNVPWDVDYNHAVRFASASARHDYFSIDWTAAPLVNLDFGTGFRTSAVVTTENTRAASQYNYAVIYDTTNDLYYYYFVQRAEYLAANKYRYHLVCDVIQQTLFDITFGDCMIRRAHLDRWQHGTTPSDAPKLNFYNDSPFLIDDNAIPDFGKRLTSRTKLGIDYKTSSGINYWINNNIKAWRYYIVSPSSYKYLKFNNGESFSLGTPIIGYYFNNQYTFGEWCVFCEPVYKTNARIRLRTTTGKENPVTKEFIWESDAFYYFTELNSGVTEAKVFTVKLSAIPPFVSLENIDVSYTSDYLTFNFTETTDNDVGQVSLNWMSTTRPESDYTAGFSFVDVYESVNNFVLGRVDRQYILGDGYPIMQTFTTVSFAKNNDVVPGTIKQNSDYYNPITCGAKCTELKITTGVGEKQAFDFRFLGKSAVSLKFYIMGIISPYTEILYISPILTSNDSILYNGYLYNSYFGYLAKTDNTVAISVNEFNAFLANQKNFFTAFQFNKAMDATKMFANIGIGAAAGAAAGGAPGAVVGGASGLISGIVGIYRDYQNTRLQIENMQAAPERLTAGSGDILTNTAISDLNIFAEVYTCTNFAIDQITDFTKKFGYAFNRLGNVSDYIGIRKLWNFIQADVETVNSTNDDNPIGVEMHDQIKTIFARGITFWANPAGISDYSGQNYEVFLDG